MVLSSPEAVADRRYVNRRVKGLYESVPAAHRLSVGGLKLQGAPSRWDSSYKMDLSYSSGRRQAEGFLVRTVKPDSRGKFKLDLGNASLKNADARIPKFINPAGTVPLVPGRGTPTVVFGTLQIMRLHDVPLGGLSSITSYISNGRAAVELMASPSIKRLKGKPSEAALARAFLRTQSGRYFKTIAQQSGHRITGVRVKTEQYEDHSVAALKRSDPTIARLLSGVNKARIDLPLFEVELTLAPDRR